ncbi:hypothetical protein M0534_09580 [Methylonatrum kenyense]|uniref:hypothetical protein n=1 Tax=Methylonatrum kenyense TaxID=455253 RepID=UPI0020C00ACB|nr:hypothetical protein [Methylonatrum kenyense]MCK8516572.1 hypothetical protein [Methylonatrum kenyense]
MTGAAEQGLAIRLQGETLHQLPRRAIWWPARRTLILADAHRQLQTTLVAGNHDRGLDRLPEDWMLDWRHRPLADGPFVFRHEPEPMRQGCVLAGHLHPVLRLRGRPTSRRTGVLVNGG